MAFNINSPSDLATLKTELIDGPHKASYLPLLSVGDAHAPDGNGLRDMVNSVLNPSDQVPSDPIPSDVFRQSIIDTVELPNVPGQTLAAIDFFMNAAPTINLSDPKVQAAFAVWLPEEAFPQSAANIQAAAVSQATRAEVLFGKGTRLNTDAVTAALNS